MTLIAVRGIFDASCLGAVPGEGAARFGTRTPLLDLSRLIDCLVVRKSQQRLPSVQLLPENGQHRPPKENRTGAQGGDAKGDSRARSFATDFTVRTAQFA